MNTTSPTHAAINIITLGEGFSVSGEMTEADFKKIAQTGIDTLINVRPDNESPNQLNSEQWQTLANTHGIRYVHIPVKPCQYTPQDIAQFKAAIAQSTAGAHSFCRTGTRAAHLWALANKDTMPLNIIQSQLNKNGYDLNMIISMFNDAF